MSSFEKEHNSEFRPDDQIFMDLTDQITYLFDDAFARMLDNGRGLAEFVQIDTFSQPEMKMYSVLLSENGGKAKTGIEQLRISAYKKGEHSGVAEAAYSMIEEGSNLAFDSSQYFISHKSMSGEWRYSRVDDLGISPWVPNLKDLTIGDLALFNELNFEEGSWPTQSQKPKFVINQQRLHQIDVAYAEELITKINKWFFIPNN